MKIIILTTLIFTSLQSFALTYDSCEKGVDDYYEPYFNENVFNSQESLDFTLNCSGAISSQKFVRDFEDLDLIRKELLFSKECILASLKSTPKNDFKSKPPIIAHHYHFCEPGENKTKTALIQKPCITKRYHFLTYLSFMAVLNCLNTNLKPTDFDFVSPREFFSLLHLESNFQINVSMPSAYPEKLGLGIGQLTESAVGLFNKSKIFDEYKNSNSCGSLKKLISEQLDKSNLCDWIRAPNGLIKNIFYSAVMYKESKKSAFYMLQKSKIFKKLIVSDKKSMILNLARTIYNAGPNEVAKSLAEFDDENSEEISSYGQFKNQFKLYLAQNFNADPTKRKIVAEYAGAIETNSKAIDSQLGSPGLCSEN